MDTKILLADDHRLMRDSLRSIVESQPDMAVVGEAEDGRQAVQLAQELAPDVVLMDVVMPEVDGISATRQILAHQPATKVLALSMHGNRIYVDRMLNAGASGYLLKDCAFKELPDAVRMVAAGRPFISPGIARQ